MKIISTRGKVVTPLSEDNAVTLVAAQLELLSVIDTLAKTANDLLQASGGVQLQMSNTGSVISITTKVDPKAQVALDVYKQAKEIYQLLQGIK